MPFLSVLHILRTIKERGAVSRTELQSITGLSWGTITNTTRELLDRNLIREEGALQTKAGRKPVRLSINPSSHVILGVDIAPHLLQVLALNLAGETLFYQQKPYTMALAPDQVLDLVADLVTTALAAPAAVNRRCLGVGVAAQGVIDVAAGIMKSAPRMPGWTNVPIRDYLARRINQSLCPAHPIDVMVEHDPRCLALAERWFGEAASADDVLCINLGDGISLGILVGGEVFRGSQEMAGEFGHMTVDPNGPPCACGDHGCIEAFCSIPAVIEAARAQTMLQSPALRAVFASREPVIADLIDAARRNDVAALEAFRQMGRYLGIGMANLVDLFNPALLVLAGPLTPAYEFFMPAFDVELQRHAWKHATKKIIISALGPRAIAMGACGQVLQHLFAQVTADTSAAEPRV